MYVRTYVCSCVHMYVCMYTACLYLCRSGGRGSLHVEGNEEVTGSSSGSSISLDIPTASTVVYIGRFFNAAAWGHSRLGLMPQWHSVFFTIGHAIRGLEWWVLTLYSKCHCKSLSGSRHSCVSAVLVCSASHSVKVGTQSAIQHYAVKNLFFFSSSSSSWVFTDWLA